jgi:hypothetical protein
MSVATPSLRQSLLSNALSNTISIDQFHGIEINVKEFFDPIIQLCLLKLNEVLNKQGVAIVVSGGEAFNFYFASNEAIETHDYDLRILFLDPNNYSLSNHVNILEQARDYCSQKFVEDMNEYFNEANERFGGILRKFFINYDSALLNTIRYGIGNFPESSLIDLTIYSPNFSGMEHIGFSDVLFPENTSKIETEGFTKNFVTPVKSKLTGILYVKLGYLIWDTVRMLRKAEDDRKKALKKGKTMGPGLKYERYVKKYIYLINALSDPETYLKCEAMVDYVVKCANQISRNKTKCEELSIEDIIKSGIYLGLFPTALAPKIKHFEKRYLCDLISNNISKDVKLAQQFNASSEFEQKNQELNKLATKNLK